MPVWTCSVVPCDITAQYSYCFYCVLGTVERSKNQTEAGEYQTIMMLSGLLFREHFEFGLFLLSLGFPMLQHCWVIAILHLGVNLIQVFSFFKSLLL
uniref:Macaca fascicularis brain cDNA clone: QflA-23035, similar to human Cdc42 guanine nucleotide exchange factor (GEF) 9(ARHGEF9), mRNA, RefSeq: XM_377014.1 n=1 Tax=Macaca fascicularis TaxID=9541 RepID=I7GDM3_MACFA|nr:unnamed protein product [Macaca fascicularis]